MENPIAIPVRKMEGIRKYTGMMFRRHPEMMVFENKKEARLPINTMFCRYPILCIFYDRYDIPIDAIELKPWVTSYLPKFKWKKLLEIPLIWED